MSKTKKIVIISVVVILLLVVILLSVVLPITLNKNKDNNADIDNEQSIIDKIYPEDQLIKDNDNKYRYISDLPTAYQKVGGGSGPYGETHPMLDKNIYGDPIKMYVDGEIKNINKGVGAHAPSTLIYDVSELGFDYFSALLGLDASTANKGGGVTGVIFEIYTTTDSDMESANWQEEYKSEPILGENNAKPVNIDIRGKHYIKLVANTNGNNWSDHAIYANAMFRKADFDGKFVDLPKEVFGTVEEYDAELEKYTPEQVIAEHENLLLKREFVAGIGYENLKFAYNYYGDDILGEAVRTTIKWLASDEQALKYYITGGEPEGGAYVGALRVLTQLYTQNKADLQDKSVADHSTIERGEVFKKMMISIALTHGKPLDSWISKNTSKGSIWEGEPYQIYSDPLEKYNVYKTLHKDNKLLTKMNVTKYGQEIPEPEMLMIFDYLSIEEMRYVMVNRISNDEIIWLNDYVTGRYRNYLENNDYKDRYPEWKCWDPYMYVTYTTDFTKNNGYNNPIYYDKARYDSEWNSKYNLSKYGIKPYEDYKQRLFMVFEQGGVCGAIANTGANINVVFGTPSVQIYQPGHAAYLEFGAKKVEGGARPYKGVWSIKNDVSGWTASGRTGRLPNGWGDIPTDPDIKLEHNISVPYILLAQEALNDLANYEKALEYVRLAKVYADNPSIQVKIYNLALSVQPINLDAWYGIIKAYKAMNKNEAEYLKLAERITENLKYHPMPMMDLLSMIEGNIKSNAGKSTFELYKGRALNQAKNVTGEQSMQADQVRVLANKYLGGEEYKFATFSFDGDKSVKNKIKLNVTDSTGLQFDYAIKDKASGGRDWHTATGAEVTLTDSQVAEITEGYGIYVKLKGASAKDEYHIIIRPGDKPTNIYANDNENKVVGVADYAEWSTDNNPNGVWTKFVDKMPDLTGNKTIYVRNGRHENYLEGVIDGPFKFTTDVIDPHYKYIPISHLSIFDFSTDQEGRDDAVHAIDGNIHTIWHTQHSGGDNDRFITIKLDKPRAISKLEYVPRQAGNNNGIISEAKILISNDGKTWTEVTPSVIWAVDRSIKTVKFDNPIKAQYVKLQAVQSYGGHASAAMINLYEDITI